MSNNCTTDFNLIGNLEIPAAYLKQALETPDAIQVAAQMGRLDVLMLFLAILAFGGFFYYRRVVDRAARDETLLVCPGLVSSYLRDNPHVLREAIISNKTILLAAISGFAADPTQDFSAEIASAMEGGNEPGAKDR